MSDIGLDLLMNPKKRISSNGSENVYRIGDDDVYSEGGGGGGKVLGSRSRSKSSRSSSRSSGGSSSSTTSSTSSSDNSDTSSEVTTSSDASSYAPSVRKKLSQEDIVNMKKELLYQFDRMEKKGIKLPRKFTLANSLEEIKVEYERLKKDREVDVSIRFQRRTLMTIITGIEFLNDKFDPFDVDLDGWSENINDGIEDYDDIFEELHEKYKGKANIPPELKLMFAVVGSGFMFHLRNSMFKSQIQGMPNARDQRKAAKAAASGGGGFLSGLMNAGGLMSSLFGGGGFAPGAPAAAPQPAYAQPQAQHMRGPTNVEDILKELANERVDMVSTISESEVMSELGGGGEGSVTYVAPKKGGAPRRTLNL